MAAWGHCHMSGFFHIINCIMGRVCWPAISVSIDDGVFCSDVRQQTLFQDELTVVA